MSGSKKQDRFHSGLWSNRQVVERTVRALEQQQAAFSRDHQNDTAEELLVYLRQAVEPFGVTPCAEEIIGGPHIARHFGSWERAVAAAKLEPPHALPPLNRRKIYKREFKQQALLFKHKKAYRAGQQALWEARRAEAAASAAMGRARIARDMEWGSQHGGDTDEQLLDYVLWCAAELEHTPFQSEVLGGAYIAQRFGGWNTVLQMTGLRPRNRRWRSPAIGQAAGTESLKIPK